MKKPKSQDTDKINLQLIEQQYGFEKAEARVQKIFWGLLLVFILSGILGVFGNGAMSKKTSKGKTFEINYERFIREDSPGKFSVRLLRAEAPAIISINRSYLEKVRIEQVFPNPAEIQIQEEQVDYKFNINQRGTVIFYVKPLNSGIANLKIGVQGENKEIKQFVYF